MRKQLKTILSCFLIIALIAAMASMISSCGKAKKDAETAESGNDTKAAETAESGNDTKDAETAESGNDTKAGKTFTFVVVDDKGESKEFKITTEKEMLGAALLDEKLIEGEDSQYGLMVNSVNGLKADYNADGAYWALYIGEEYAMTGVDSTPVEDGATYKFVYTKA